MAEKQKIIHFQNIGTFMIITHFNMCQYCFPWGKTGKFTGLVKRDYLYRLLLIGSAWI